MSALIAKISIVVCAVLIFGAIRSAKFNDSFRVGLWNWKGFSIDSDSLYLQFGYVYKHRSQFFRNGISFRSGREAFPGITAGENFLRYRFFSSTDAATTTTLNIPYLYPITLSLLACAVSGILTIRDRQRNKAT